jgi:hypothetical protein
MSKGRIFQEKYTNVDLKYNKTGVGGPEISRAVFER